LRKLPGALVLGSATQKQQVLADNIDRWVSLLREGRTPDAWKEIDAAGFDPTNAAFVKAQCLLVTGRGRLAHSLVAPEFDELLLNENPALLCCVAKIAWLSGDDNNAKRFLTRLRDVPLCDAHSLRAAVELAESVGEDTLATSLREQLLAAYPTDDTVVRAAVLPLLRAEQYAEAERFLSRVDPRDRTQLARYFAALCDCAQDGSPDALERFVAHSRAISSSFGLLAEVDRVRILLKRLRFDEAAALLVSIEQNSAVEHDVAMLGIRLIERLLLAPAPRPGEPLPGPPDRLTGRVLLYVSTHPGEGEIRLALARLFSAEVAGNRGAATLLASALAHSSTPPHIRETDVSDRPATADVLSSLRQLAEQAVPQRLFGSADLDFGSVACTPPQVVDEVVSILATAITHAGQRGTLETVELFSHVGLSAARQLDTGLAEFLLLRLAAIAYIPEQPQRARDLAEHALKLAAARYDHDRARAAWMVFADVYHRLHNLFEATMALACARALPVPTSSTLQDTYAAGCLTARIARDVGLDAAAHHAVEQVRSLVTGAGLSPENEVELKSLAASIDVMLTLRSFAREKTPDVSSRLRAAATQVSDVVKVALERDVHPFPPVHLLAQVLGAMRHFGETDEAAELLLLSVTANLAPAEIERVRAVLDNDAGYARLGRLSAASGGARFAQDIGADIAEARSISKRLLTQQSALTSARAAFLTEWLCDQSLRLPTSGADPTEDRRSEASSVVEWTLQNRASLSREELAGILKSLGASPSAPGVEGTPFFKTPDDVLQAARQLAVPQAVVHFLALDEVGRLVRSTCSSDPLSFVVEPSSVFDIQRLMAWKAASYPAAFADMDSSQPTGLNDVEAVMRGLGSTIAPTSVIQVIVRDIDLDAIPANVIPVRETLLGLASAVATTPSLRWWAAARRCPRPRSDRRVAWISTDSKADAPTLPLLHDLVHEPLEEHAFSIHSTPTPSSELEGADVVFVGAHGGLHESVGFFRVVADEGTTRMTARQVARACADAGIVILAVCSSGRSDRDPLGGGSHGLARLLLDHGCRAVVAPPWPLEVVVMGRWVPAFLDKLDAGAPVAQCAFHANSVIRAKFSDHPARCLAMHVYGDPLACEAPSRR
jgi:tetratricopeptide (TPR) repeat protein